MINAEIGAMIPETGGQYVFFERMYGPFSAYLYGWAIFAVIQTGSIAAVAYVFAEYSTQFVPLPELSGPAARWSLRVPFIGDIAPQRDLGVKAVAAGMIGLLTVVNYLGVRFGGLVQNVFTLTKLAAMAGLMLLAWLTPGVGRAANFTTDSAVIRPEGLALFAALAAALQGAFWAYDGWNKLPYLAGEVKEPQRNIPRGLLWGMLVVTVFYVLMNVAYFWVLPVEEMAKSKLVAADVAEKCLAGGGRWIAAAVMISTFGAANAMILANARVFFRMAQQRVFPGPLGRVHPRFHTPGASLVAQGVWSTLLLFSGTFDTLTDMLIFVSWIFYGAGAYGVFVLRRKEPDTPRPYRVPGYPVLPWVFVLFSALFLAFTLRNDLLAYQAARAAGEPALINSALGLVLVFLGTPIYFYCRRKACHERPTA
jgi:APA family basic amino acid/polyamine antiporter